MEQERRVSENDLKMLSNDSKFNDRFYRLRRINKYTDCSFKIENRVINCHKLILSASSPVFEAMFYGKFSNDITNSTLITDISYNTFELLMDFIYTGELKLRENDEIQCLVEINYCAQKYLIDELRKICLDKQTEILNRNNVFEFLEKSFEFHLEDFLVSCLYFFVDSIETGHAMSNAIINSKIFISNQCFEFLMKNVLDYFGEREDILCLIKAWTIKKCHGENALVTPESLTSNTELLNLDNSLYSKIAQMKAGFFDTSNRIAKSFHRVYYRAVRPLILERNQLCFDVHISFKRFIAIKSFTINSRLMPEQFDISDVGNQMYTEKLSVEIFDKSSNRSIYKQHHIVENVVFNESFKIKFNERMILFPYHVYVIKILWSDESVGFEYPRAIFSPMEKGNGNEDKVDKNGNPVGGVVQFHEFNYGFNFPVGSIVQGIFYDIIS